MQRVQFISFIHMYSSIVCGNKRKYLFYLFGIDLSNCFSGKDDKNSSGGFSELYKTQIGRSAEWC
jgi:hypothetical protein